MNIKKAELIDGKNYRGTCRNATIAVWDAKTNKFYYLRNKFGIYGCEAINHYEDDNGFDLFTPTEIIE